MKLFQKPMHPDVFIHATAVVEEGAQLGAGTRVWHFAHLMPRCRIGTGCQLGQGVFIDNDVVIGNGVKIQNQVSVYSGVQLDDFVFIGPSVVFTNVTNPRAFIERKTEFQQTRVCTGASIGANATIRCGLTIGQYALVGAGAVVTRTVLPFALVYGNPARQHGWVSRAGHKLVFDAAGSAQCPEEKKGYQLQNGMVTETPGLAK